MLKFLASGPVRQALAVTFLLLLLLLRVFIPKSLCLFKRLFQVCLKFLGIYKNLEKFYKNLEKFYKNLEKFYKNFIKI